MDIRVGNEEDIDSLEELYNNINDYLESTINYPGWKKGIYPVRKDAEDGIREGNLFVAVENGDIIGSMILRHEPEPAYLNVSWQAELDYSNVLVIYTFVVNPKFLKRGVGKNMLDFIEEYAMDNKIKSIRLDVYEKNIPAISLYEKCHYKFSDTVSLGLEDIGLNWFKLYEKII